jgi:hypothetical protein
MQVHKTSTGIIIERPSSSFVVEAARLPRGVFQFHYSDRHYGQEEAYDTRYVDQYTFPYAWLVGWWRSYQGFMPHTDPVPLHPHRPFHHPWLVTAELVGDEGDFTDHTCQRKPVFMTEGRDCWWAIELSTQAMPTLDVPDLLAAVPQIAGVPGLSFPSADLDEWGQQVLALVPGLLAGLSNRKEPERIAAWAWTAAQWVSDHADDKDEDGNERFFSMLDALLEFKWTVIIEGIKVPTSITMPKPRQETLL